MKNTANLLKRAMRRLWLLELALDGADITEDHRDLLHELIREASAALEKLSFADKANKVIGEIDKAIEGAEARPGGAA